MMASHFVNSLHSVYSSTFSASLALAPSIPNSNCNYLEPEWRSPLVTLSASTAARRLRQKVRARDGRD